MRTYKTKEALRLVGGISQNQLVHWAEKGVVRPTAQDADGHGSYRLYTFRDLVKVAVVKEFLEFGISLSTIRTLLAVMVDGQYGDGVRGGDGKLYANLWDGLRMKRKAFRYFMGFKKVYSRRDDSLAETDAGGMYSFVESICLPKSVTEPVTHALFVSILDIVESLESVTGDSF
jgi:DNA-binding transcriptional MerR regulator